MIEKKNIINLSPYHHHQHIIFDIMKKGVCFLCAYVFCGHSPTNKKNEEKQNIEKDICPFCVSVCV